MNARDLGQAVPASISGANQPLPARPPALPPLFLAVLLTILVLAALLSGCQRQPELLQLEGAAFGTRYQILLADPELDRDVGLEPLAEEVERTLETLDQVFSTWRPDSEISRINAAEADIDLTVSEDFRQILIEAQMIHALSGGALDIALLPLTRAWGFHDARNISAPDDSTVAEILAYSGMEHLAVAADGTSLRKQDSRQAIDVSALAKGYAVDRLAAQLRDAGADNFLVEFGGEIRVQGTRAGNKPWRIAVESPATDLPILALELSNEAVATSGDYRNHIVMDGDRFGHVLDPASGRPASRGVVAATVIAPTALRADSLATAFLLMEDDAAFELAESLDVGLRRVIRGPAGFLSRENATFRERLAPNP